MSKRTKKKASSSGKRKKTGKRRKKTGTSKKRAGKKKRRKASHRPSGSGSAVVSQRSKKKRRSGGKKRGRQSSQRLTPMEQMIARAGGMGAVRQHRLKQVSRHNTRATVAREQLRMRAGGAPYLLPAGASTDSTPAAIVVVSKPVRSGPLVGAPGGGFASPRPRTGRKGGKRKTTASAASSQSPGSGKKRGGKKRTGKKGGSKKSGARKTYSTRRTNKKRFSDSGIPKFLQMKKFSLPSAPSKHVSRKARAATRRAAGYGRLTAKQILRNAKLNRQKVWICTGKRRTGCGGGSKNLRGSHQIGVFATR